MFRDCRAAGATFNRVTSNRLRLIRSETAQSPGAEPAIFRGSANRKPETELLTSAGGHSSPVVGCAWSPDGTRLLSASWDDKLRIWDASSGDCLSTLSGHSESVRACAWSPDGTRLLSASEDKTLRIWDASSGDCLSTLSGHSASVRACAWSPDGTRLLSASDDKTLRIWDAVSGDYLSTLSGHSSSVTVCAWSPDGTRLLSASWDGLMRLWDAESGKPLAAFHVFGNPRARGAGWAALDLANNRVLSCSEEAWRDLRWIRPAPAGGRQEALPAEYFGPLPVKPGN